MPNCRSCKKEILWLAHHDTGKTMPVDLVPVVGGGIKIDVTGTKYRMITADELSKALLNRIPLHTSHFATCPDAQNFRKTK